MNPAHSKITTFCIIIIALWNCHTASIYARHPIHATVTSIEYNTKTKGFEVSCKIFADDLEEAQKAAKMLTETHKGSADIFAKSKGQVIVLGRIMGCNVKGLVDLAPDGEDFLADLKTTADFSARGFESTIDKFGYHVQAGLYLALWNTMFPDDKRSGFKFVWQDKAPPYEVAVTELTPSEIDEGLAQAAHLIEKLVNATKSNHWPMKFEKEFMVMRPTYAAMREEAERQQEGSEP
jgi:hypothetical protein